MPANNLPIYTKTPDVSSNNSTTLGTVLTTATGDYTGQSANHVLEHTAGSNGSYIRKLRFKAIGTNVATVARIYINNGSTNATAANNSFFGEVSLPATTASNSATTPDMDYVMEIALPASFRLYVGLGTTVAAGWNCIAVAGQY
jgi:hypothetical protein